MRITTAATLAVLISLGVQAQAETMKLAVGQRGTWDTSVAEIGVRGGIFQKHGLELEILYTQGGGETQQAVISGSVDVGVAAGMMGVLAAFAKGAPVRIIGSEMTGATEMFFYVPAKSKIRSLKDIGTGTIGYSTNGSSTHGVVTALVKQYDLKAQPVAAGSHRRRSPGSVGPDRRRLVGATVRSRPAGPRRHPHRCQRQRCNGIRGQTVRLDCQCAGVAIAQRTRSSASCGPIAKRSTGCMPAMALKAYGEL